MYSYRTDIKDTYHHITARGVNKLKIFLNPEDKNFFLKKIKKILNDLDIILIAYTVMDNHFHLFVKRNKNSIAKFMQRLLTAYAMYYNKKYKRTGHVFERRYYSSLIDSDSYFYNVLVYIHQNIIRKRSDIEIHEYQWSSFKDYINFDDSLINIEYVINFLKLDKKNFINSFFAIHKILLPKNSIKGERVREHNILGTKKFIEFWMEKLKNKKRGNFALNKKRKITEDDVFNFVLKETKIDKIKLLNNEVYTTKEIVNIRKTCYYLLSKFCGLTYTDIGKIFKIHSNTISYHIKKKDNIDIDNKFINFINNKNS